MYKFTSFSLYFSFFLSVSAFFHVFFFSIKFFLKFSSDYWGGKKGVLPPHPNYWGGACPGCPPESTPMRIFLGRYLSHPNAFRLLSQHWNFSPFIARMGIYPYRWISGWGHCLRFRSMNTVEDVVVDCLPVYDENRGSLSRLFLSLHRMMRSEMTSTPLVAWTGSTHRRSSSQIEDGSRCSSSRIQMNQP